MLLDDTPPVLSDFMQLLHFVTSSTILLHDFSVIFSHRYSTRCYRLL